MKRLKLILCLIFIAVFTLIGCEKKVEVFPPEAAAQTDNLKAETDKYQSQEEQREEGEAEEVVEEKTEEAEKSAEEKVIEEAANKPIEATKSDASEIVIGENNKQENKTPEKYLKYLGYWQLDNRDIKYNDVIRGFSVPLEIVSISDNIFIGSISFRMRDSYHANPGLTIKIHDEIKDNIVNFDFEDKAFASGHGLITLNDDTVEVEIKYKETNPEALFSFEGRKVYKKIPEENLIVNTTPKNIFGYLEFSKKEMINKLGKNYEIIVLDDGVYETTGYFYPAYGLTFEFEDEEGNHASRITCNEAVEINGARSKMNFEQIQQYLGKQEVMEIVDGRIPGQELKTYQLLYRIYETMIRFDSLGKDGENSVLSISKS